MSQVQLPTAWRNISAITSDGTVIYYTPATNACLPKRARRTLVRRTHKPSHVPTTYNSSPQINLAAARLLVVVNPAAGKGPAGAAARADALRVLTAVCNDNQIELVVHNTTHRGHVLHIFRHVSYPALCQFAAVVSVGGDGTLHEVVNALAHISNEQNADCSHAPPIAVVPCGTGNAIAVSIGLETPTHAALNIVHSLRTAHAKPLALMQYRRLSTTHPERFSVCGMQWGLPAEVDYGTERLRWMGDARFDLGAALAILSKKAWSARIRVTVHGPKHRALCNELRKCAPQQADGKPRHLMSGLQLVAEDTYVLDSRYVLAVGWNSSAIADGFVVTPYASITETEAFDFIVFHAGMTRVKMLSILNHTKDGSYPTMSQEFHYFKATKVEFERFDGHFLTIDGELVPMEPFVLEMADNDGKLRFLDSFTDQSETPLNQTQSEISSHR